MKKCDIEGLGDITNRREMPTSSLDSMLDELVIATENLEHDCTGVFFEYERDQIVDLFWDWWQSTPDRFNTSETPGDRLRECRVSCGMNQSELAEMLSQKTARETISNWERNSYKFPEEKAERFAEILGVRPEYLKCEDPFKTKDEFRSLIQELEQTADKIINERLELKTKQFADKTQEETDRHARRTGAIHTLWSLGGYTTEQVGKAMQKYGFAPDVPELNDPRSLIEYGINNVRFVYRVTDGENTILCSRDDIEKLYDEIENFALSQLSRYFKAIQKRVQDFEKFEQLIKEDTTTNG